ncbi:hypothetical protein Rcae01_02716 [Novipirellula caenicola]|uniref:Sulfotransferase domain protein n=1 Tax=Novipirellula caenicola TaxID=1536901 RepID=A0ABP9VRI7_9BACT
MVYAFTPMLYPRRLPTRLRFLYHVFRPFRRIYVYRNPRHMIVQLLRFFGLS